jgi:hypothetical protein
MSPSDLLRAYAQIAEQNPLEMESTGGPNLQKAFVSFLSENAYEGADLVDAQRDIANLTAKFLVAIVLAAHEGQPCFDCINNFLLALGTAISDEAEAHLQYQDPKGAH